MAESRRKKIEALGWKVADDLVRENPPPDKVYKRVDLMTRAGLKPDSEPDARTEMHFFQALNVRLQEKSGRMFVSNYQGGITIPLKRDTVSTSEGLALRDVMQAFGRHLDTLRRVMPHLSSQERAEALDSMARIGNLDAQARAAANHNTLQVTK
jgi:hypothetical protein